MSIVPAPEGAADDFGLAAPPVPIGALLRAARHRADLSQRELADRAGVDRSMVARIEAGVVLSPGFPWVIRLLAAAGCRLLALDEDDEPLRPRPYDDARNAGWRRFPAHLEVRAVRTAGDWWFGFQRPGGTPLPRHTFDGRSRRDSRRDWAQLTSGNTPSWAPLRPEASSDG